MFKTFRNYCGLAFAYFRINLNAQLEYRAAFFSEAMAMFINDAFWVVFWMVFFARFPVLRGWTLEDILTVWAIASAGFGIANAVMGNGWNLATIIANGQLDMWMLHPRAVLPHLLLGKTIATAWGDAVFGYVVYLAFVRPDPARFALFVALSISVAALFVGFSVASASLSFYVGNAGALAEQWRMAMLTFSTYPQTLFDGVVKVVLFTAVPAAFASYLPVLALRSLSLWDAVLAMIGSAAVVLIGVVMFYIGLRRYESGNLISMHG